MSLLLLFIEEVARVPNETSGLYTWSWQLGSSHGPLLPPNSPNLYPHFDAIYLYGLHLKVDTWEKEESKKIRN